jgi:hypothetical protein
LLKAAEEGERGSPVRYGVSEMNKPAVKPVNPTLAHCLRNDDVARSRRSFTADGDVVEPRRTIQQNALNVENLTLEPKK